MTYKKRLLEVQDLSSSPPRWTVENSDEKPFGSGKGGEKEEVKRQVTWGSNEKLPVSDCRSNHTRKRG